MVQEIQEKQSLGNYLILEGRAHGSYEYPDILVAAGRTHQRETWYRLWDSLHAEGKFMPTIRQYVDFLSDLRSSKKLSTGDGKELNTQRRVSILDEILELRNPYRAEHLDASFSKQGEQFYITYHKFNSAGSLEQVQEPLQECLMQDKTPGIDLEDWFKKANEQGLPSPKTKKGSLYYWCPREGRVAGFDAYSGRAILNCDRDPLASYSALGVREGISVAGGRGRDEMII